MPYSTASITIADYNGEQSTMNVSCEVIADDGSNFAALNTAFDTLETAIQGITRGLRTRKQVNYVKRLGNGRATDPEAQREEKWLVTYEDISAYLDSPANTLPNPGQFKLYNAEIPCADLSLRVGNSELLYPYPGGAAPTPLTDFISAFQAFVKSPTGGSVVIKEIRAVGRNT